MGEALARLLAAAGVRLSLTDVGCCGRTALSTGQIERARAAARRALDGLHVRVRDGAEVLFIEPSCLSMVRDDWARLLPGDSRVAEVAAAARPALALVADLAVEGRLRFRAGGRASPAQPLPREGAGLRRGDEGRPGRRSRSRGRGSGRRAAAACPACSATRPNTTRSAWPWVSACCCRRCGRRGRTRPCSRPVRRAGRRCAISVAAPLSTRSSSSPVASRPDRDGRLTPPCAGSPRRVRWSS